ncbi:MAG: SBBP repeat-containing protein [Rhizobacter sp.]|nr:SBBP repeat-containing protein [Ferruginibacter sp.]
MKIIFTFISLLFFSLLHAQNANLVWAKQMGSNNADQGLAIAVDAAGNVYTTGYFLSIADFNPDPAVTFNLTPAGQNDIFISKLDASGNFVWAKQLGGTFNDQGYGIAVDASGNVYTTGSFQGTADFNPDPAVTFNLASSGGSNDIFISKLDASGNFVWARQFGSTSNDQGSSITTDASGNVYTTGYFAGTADFNPNPAVTNNLISANGSFDVFISKLDASGNFVWAKQLGGLNTEMGYSIAVDALGNVYTTGTFQGTLANPADFDPSPAATYYLISAGQGDIFVSKLDASGNFVWAKPLGGASVDIGYSIVTDALGNVYTTGYFNGTADFNPDPAVSYNLTAANADVFISKLDAAGNFVWAKQLGGTSGEVGYSIAVDASANVYTAGYFQGTVDFNPDPAVTNNLITAGQADIFVSKLDASGNFLFAKQFGGTGVDQGYSIALDAARNIHTTGYFSGTADLDPDPAVINNFTVAGVSSDIFVVKLSQLGTVPVTLSGFTVNNSRCTANLTWTTATEQNSKHFEVQYSTNGITFTTIGTVLSSGNSTTEKYYGYSSSLVNPNNFFRLRIIDRDGSSKLSAVVYVAGDCGANIIITVFPNPAKNVVTVSGLSGVNQLRLLDQLGKIVKVIMTNKVSETINLSNFSEGTYVIQIVQNNKVSENIKFIKK